MASRMISHMRLVKLLGCLTLAGLAGRAEDWNAKWIAAQPDGEVPALRMPIFRRAVRLDKPVARAVIDISGLGQYELSVNGRKIGDAVLSPGWTNYRKTVYYNTFRSGQARGARRDRHLGARPVRVKRQRPQDRRRGSFTGLDQLPKDGILQHLQIG